MNLKITNALVVARDEMFRGDLLARGRDIARVARESAPRAQESPGIVDDVWIDEPADAVDFEGDWLLPGFVDVCSCNLDVAAAPKPGAHWPAGAAVQAHDAQMAAAGITTVFNSLFIGEFGLGDRLERLEALVGALAAARSAAALRARHRLHLRCDVSCSGLQALMAHFAFHPLLGLVSVVDRSSVAPFSEADDYARFHDVAALPRVREAPSPHACVNRKAANRDAVIALAASRGLPLVMRSAETAKDVEEARIGGASAIDSPQSLEAAQAARRSHISVSWAAPDLIAEEGGSPGRGASTGHIRSPSQIAPPGRSKPQSEIKPAEAVGSGAAAGSTPSREGLVDALYSDWAPLSLVMAAFKLGRTLPGGIPAAVRLASLDAARLVGLENRGEIAPGKRADFIRVRMVDDMPVVRAVWRSGKRIA